MEQPEPTIPASTSGNDRSTPVLSKSEGLLGHIIHGFLYYYLTGQIVLAGGILGSSFLVKSNNRGRVFDNGTGAFFVNWDGQWYKNIARVGYFYEYSAPSSVAFLPAYPMAARGLAAVTGLEMDLALLFVANFSLLATFVISAHYFDKRSGVGDSDSTGYALLAMGLTPTTFFFRMAYSESLFLLLVSLLLVGMARNWPSVALAAIIGLSTATRAAGVALTPALAYHIWTRHPEPRARVKWLVGLLPVALWGLVAYMAFLALEFGDPLAYMKSHIHWNAHPDGSAADKLRALLILRPLWCRFDPASSRYWSAYDQHDMPFFSLYLADPIYFLITVGLVVVGARRGWLTVSEVIVAAGLITMPLAFKCYETDMVGFGRYAATVLPVYIVLGKLLSRVPAPIAAGLLAISGTMMAIYAALFSAWYVLL